MMVTIGFWSRNASLLSEENKSKIMLSEENISTIMLSEEIVVVLAVLSFYVHDISKVMSARSLNLTTLFLGRLGPPKRLTSTSCTYFRQ